MSCWTVVLFQLLNCPSKKKLKRDFRMVFVHSGLGSEDQQHQRSYSCTASRISLSIHSVAQPLFYSSLFYRWKKTRTTKWTTCETSSSKLRTEEGGGCTAPEPLQSHDKLGNTAAPKTFILPIRSVLRSPHHTLIFTESTTQQVLLSWKLLTSLHITCGVSKRTRKLEMKG